MANRATAAATIKARAERAAAEFEFVEAENARLYEVEGKAARLRATCRACGGHVNDCACWRAGDPCAACGSTDTYGTAGHAGCNSCSAHDHDGG